MQIIIIEQFEKLKILSANPYFSGLKEEPLKDLSLHMSLRHFERGENVFWEGDPCSGLHILEKGSVKLFRVSPQGRQYIVRVAQESDTFNEVPVFDSGTNPVNVEALEECNIWVVEAEAVRALMKSDPEFTRRTAETLARMMRHLIGIVSEMAFYQVTHRLARLIRDIPSDELSGDTGTRWTQDRLAARLGTVREVVARSLKELELSGAIRVENRRIYIDDPAILAEWSPPWN
jgi:CRP-like cAMP-binding protein